MNKTRADLIKQVIINLGKLGNDEPSSEDSDKVDRVIDPTVSSLGARNIYTVNDAGVEGTEEVGSIEPEIFLELADCVALAAAPAFNMEGDAKLIALAARAENRLEIIAAPPRTRRTLKIERALRTPRRGGYYNGTNWW